LISGQASYFAFVRAAGTVAHFFVKGSRQDDLYVDAVPAAAVADEARIATTGRCQRAARIRDAGEATTLAVHHTIQRDESLHAQLHVRADVDRRAARDDQVAVVIDDRAGGRHVRIAGDRVRAGVHRVAGHTDHGVQRYAGGRVEPSGIGAVGSVLGACASGLSVDPKSSKESSPVSKFERSIDGEEAAIDILARSRRSPGRS
jgi:hypothetical protein